MIVDEQTPPCGSCSRARQQTLFSLLKSTNCIKKASQIHNQIIVNGFSHKSFLLVKLLSFYISSGHFLTTLKFFKNVKLTSVASWNQKIRCYSRTGNPRDSLVIYREMVAQGYEPDGFTYSYLLSACSKSMVLREGEQVHAKVLANGYCSNLFVRTNLVNLYAMVDSDYGIESACKVFDDMPERNVVGWNSLLAGFIRRGDIDRARRVFDEMPDKDMISWTTMVAGCAKHGKCSEALSLFKEMRRAGVELDQVALLAALSACAELGDLSLGKWIHSYIEQKLSQRSQPILVSLNNAFIHMYASCGLIEEAYNVFREMTNRTTISWTSMISGFAKQGYAREALAIFQLMQNIGSDEVKPDEITFTSVLSACSHTGLVDEGRQIFKSMKLTWGLEPRIEHYCCMTDLLSRAGFLDEACNLVETMPMKPNDAIWGALLSGCKIHQNDELALELAKNIVFELDDPDRAAGYLVLLSDIYATAKNWVDVSKVRGKMVEMGMKKPPGRSWVQINGVLRGFTAGDNTHEHASSIYEMLGCITGQIDWKGQEPGILDLYI